MTHSKEHISYVVVTIHRVYGLGCGVCGVWYGVVWAHTHTHTHIHDNKSKDVYLDTCQFPAKRSLYNSYKHQKVPTFTEDSPAYGIRDTYVRLM